MPVSEAVPVRLLNELQSARQESDRLFAVLNPDSLYDRPIAERHRVIFYVGHLDGFDSIQICREDLGLNSPDRTLDNLFQAGIDPDSAHLPGDSPTDWPSLHEVNKYIERCRKRVDENIERASEDVIQMALEHRLMHLETLAYMFHNFGYEKKRYLGKQNERRPDDLAVCENDWIEIPRGEAILGKNENEDFGWDNEYLEIRKAVPAFLIQRFKVTNGEYLKFVEQGAESPHFWVKRDSKWYYRGMFEEIPLPLDWPVYVTEHEAEAYARWIDAALPSEEQFHRAAFGEPGRANRSYPWGQELPANAFGNFNFWRWEPESVYSAPRSESAFGVRQLVGNGWEWTKTPFGPLPGFRTRETYPGYSANFFDGEHYVTKGGSQRTGARLLRRSFRNWFRRDYPYTYTGFRCVRSF